MPQKINLMSGTIAENVRYGNKDAMDEEVHAALRTAQAQEFVSELEDGIESAVAQGGTNFSGGQKQRLSNRKGAGKKAGGLYIRRQLFGTGF